MFVALHFYSPIPEVLIIEKQIGNNDWEVSSVPLPQYGQMAE